MIRRPPRSTRTDTLFPYTTLFRSRADFRAIQQLRLLDRADGEAGEVVFARRIHVRHFRGLAADQGAAGQFATTGDAADHRDRGVDVELARGAVVEERSEERRVGKECVRTFRTRWAP